jgi:outer membrane lipoprotein-sorting protein
MSVLRLALSLLLLFLIGSPSHGQSLNLQQVVQKMEKAREGVADIEAKAELSFRLSVGIIPYSDALHGSYFFKKPDRHRLDFPDAPSYLQSVPSMFSWKLPSSEKYDALVTGPTLTSTGERVYSLLFTSKNPDSKTDSITVTVDAARWRVARQDTLYRDGGSVLLTFGYIEQKGLPLLERVAGKIDIPAYRLKGNASISLSEQKVNQGVDDSVFAGSK